VGQGFAPFTVYEKEGGLTASGRAVKERYKKTDRELLGMLVNASQREIDQWKQNGHPVSHKIIEYSAQPKAKATDFLKLEHQGRQFYVQGVKNPANLNVTMIYYVEERLDIKEELE
jgi:hypothetical protein